MSYDPTLGRWLEEDPDGYADGANRYTALGSNPVNGLDPQGLSKVGPSKREKKSRQSSAITRENDEDPKLVRDPTKKCPVGEETAVIILGEVTPNGPLAKTRLIQEFFWRQWADSYADQERKSGKKVAIMRNVTPKEMQKVVIDPTTKTLIVIGHGSDEDDNQIVWLTDQYVIDPATIKRWLGGTQGPDLVIFRVCHQGMPINGKAWIDAFGRNTEFHAPTGSDRPIHDTPLRYEPPQPPPKFELPPLPPSMPVVFPRHS